MKKLRILFLCTGNSCRSQMAECFVRYLKNDEWEAWSAGTDPRELDPYVVKVMAEVGMDISGQKSKHLDELECKEFDYVMTVCDKARELCPAYNGKETNLHFGFEDPAGILNITECEEDRLEIYRRVRDLMEDVIMDVLNDLTKDTTR